MKRLVCAFTILIAGLCLSAELITLDANGNKPLIQSHEISPTQSIIDFNLYSYDLTTEIDNSTEFTRISCLGEGETYQIGMPQLPVITRFFAIPAGATLSVSVESVDTETITNAKAFPRQPENAQISGATSFTIDNEFYSSNQIFPATTIEVGGSGIFRDVSVAMVSFYPFRYNPQSNSIEVITNAQLRVDISEAGRVIEPQRKISRAFESIYKKMILNYDDISRDAEYQQPCYLFITPDDNQVLPVLETLTDWKRQMGWDVTVATTAETGTSLSSIKNYIQNAYNFWDNRPEFVCLVGDASGSYDIPCGFQNSGNSDYVYTLLDGNDLYPEVAIGRLSFGTVFDLQTIVSKILQYEKTPYMGNTDWYEHALLVGDTSNSGQSCIDTNLYIKSVIDYNQPQFDFYEVYNSPFVTQMTAAFNAGVSYFNYRGYIGMSGWGTGDVNNLTNGLMLPVAVSLTCGTGNYSSGTSMSEAFLRAGTPSAPKGGIAGIATATSSTHTTFNNSVCAGIFSSIFSDHVDNLGTALVGGKLNMYRSFPQNPSNWVTKFCHWNNLMGDPGMKVWTAVPEQIFAISESEIAVGQNFYTVDVTHGLGIPLQDAWVTLYRESDGFQESGYTDENGRIVLPCLTTLAEDFTLTVTGSNCIPIQNTITVSQQAAFCNVESYSIDDDANGSSNGNGDGMINPGETIELTIELRNSGTQSVSGASAVLSTISPFVTIISGNADFPTIPAGSSASSSAPCVIAFSADAIGETDFDVAISDNGNNNWADILQLPVAAPLLQVTDVDVLDMGNNILDPGETANLAITITNSGPMNETTLDAVLHIPHTELTVTDSIGAYSGINAGASTSNVLNTFTVEASSQLYPGMQIPATLTVENTNGTVRELAFLIEIGTVTQGDPLGSDAYGYICFDDGDINYAAAPTYDWIEIDPTFGGAGSHLSLNDSGDMGAITTINMPFIFMFYGQIYDDLTICTNGWISPGDSDNRDYMNWPVPGPQGPSPIIAAFWDDLTTSGGHVCTYHDETTHVFIIEWSDMKNDYDGSSGETFEIIIYDPAYYPTSTGDCEILIQYKEFNNVNVGTYNGYHVYQGQYCTVGIEDASGTQGLQYSFNNTYPTAAKPLQDESAIFFTVNSGAVLQPPVISLSTDSLYFAVDQTGTYQQNFTIANLGEATMMYSIDRYYVDGGQTRNSGGPDDFGHMWFDSTEPNGPVFNWRELPTSATEVTFVHNDQGTDLMPIGFDFPFYGTNYSQFRINPNGWIGFGDDCTAWNNLSLPHPDAPRPAIMPFWDDLDPITTGHVYYQSYTDSLIVWFDGVDHYSGNYNGNYTFQIIIYSDGDMRLQYLTMTGDINSATIGIQNEDNSDELQLSYNTTFVQDNMAVEIKRVVDWATISPESGIIPGGEAVTIGVQVEPQMLLLGSYMCRLSITCNDPNQTVTFLPVVMDVVGDISAISLSQDAVDFGSVPITTTSTDTLVIQNLGTANLEISEIACSNDVFSVAQTSYTILPYESAELYISFEPVELGAQTADITIFSNDPDDPEYVISAQGVGTDNTGSGNPVPLPTAYYQNYPNPFNPETTLAFSLGDAQSVNLSIFNVKGEKVKTLVDADFAPGRYEILWNGTDAKGRTVASGLYFSRFQAGSKVSIKKMMLLK